MIRCILFALLPILAFCLRIDEDDRIQTSIDSRKFETNHRKTQPIVINTWAFTSATQDAFGVLEHRLGSALDAVETGCSSCERDQCDRTVGFGGSPDELGETSLDAMIMDGDTLEVGAVGDLRHIKRAISAARLVMETTSHTLLVGLQASQFSSELGLDLANLTTDESGKMHKQWKSRHCQPNFRKNVSPDPSRHCGPYRPVKYDSSSDSTTTMTSWPTATAHDTISMIALDDSGSIAVGCSTNGAINKIPGRVGDGAVAGGCAYADSDVGGCGATGDGDIHLRFLPCFHVVEMMRSGMSPKQAAENAIRRIAKKIEPKKYVGAVVAMDKEGRHGAAAYGWTFEYAWQSMDSKGVHVERVDPLLQI